MSRNAKPNEVEDLPFVEEVKHEDLTFFDIHMAVGEFEKRILSKYDIHPKKDSKLVGGTKAHPPGTDATCTYCIQIQAAQQLLNNFLVKVFGVGLNEGTVGAHLRFTESVVRKVIQDIDKEKIAENKEIIANMIKNATEEDDEDAGTESKD